MFKTLLANKHTSGAAGVYLAASALGHIANIWFPAHSAQVNQTVQVIKEACFGYGMLAAGDAKKDAQPSSTTITKP